MKKLTKFSTEFLQHKKVWISLVVKKVVPGFSKRCGRSILSFAILRQYASGVTPESGGRGL